MNICVAERCRSQKYLNLKMIIVCVIWRTICCRYLFNVIY